MTPEQLTQLATLTKFRYPDWETAGLDALAIRWNASDETASRVLRDAPLWLNARTMASLFPTITAASILRGTEIMEAMRVAGATNATMRNAYEWMQAVWGDQPGIDAVNAGVWALVEALFPSLGMTAGELATIDHWRTRYQTYGEVEGFGPVSLYDLNRALTGF